MKITVIFEAEPGDDEDYAKLGGKSLTMDGIGDLHVSSSVDMTERPDDRGTMILREPMNTGSLTLNAHGNRAMWAETAIAGTLDPFTVATLPRSELP